MRRKRRTKYTWLPIQNGTTFPAPQSFDRAAQLFALDVPQDGSLALGVLPVVADLPQGTLTTVSDEGIGEIIGNEYVLKRIVGKCHCHVDYINTSGAPVPLDDIFSAAIVVTAGFFVARADTNNPLVPIGANETDGERMYTPANAELTRQPWIWRRTWILGAGAFGGSIVEDIGGNLPAATTLRGQGIYPTTNVGYGSVADGPHIDAKTGRRIRLEERLWFAATAYFQNALGTPTTFDTQVLVNLDCRYLGALRRPRARSNFA